MFNSLGSLRAAQCLYFEHRLLGLNGFLLSVCIGVIRVRLLLAASFHVSE